TAQCKADRTWHPPVPTCEQVVKCLPPPSITNGEHSNFSDTFGVGAVVHYRCKPGFFLTGSESIRCTPHGVWSRPLPQCEGTFTLLSSVLIFLNVLRKNAFSVAKCPCPSSGCVSPGVGQGKAIGSESFYMPGDIITIECNTDNVSKVLHKSQCQSGGTWLPPLPACDRVVKCLPPPAITNGELQGNTSDTFFYGASVSYSCDAGYSLTGDAFITCTASGTWSQPPPRCEEISCVFPEVQGVKKTTPGKTYRFGTNVTLECDDGYTLEGLSQIQCQEDFSWDPPVPACKLTSPRSGSVGLGIAAAVVLLLLGVTIGWKIISKQKEGYYRTYENYNPKTSLD
uniref:Sushi domain-containing protein n=1 Tax=Pavo cristatus TaxID=9049 RepID=A0A8C9EZD2_PAVCR